MTADTKFREFVEEAGISFSLLKVGSTEYWDLVEAYNRIKIKLRTEAKNAEQKKARRCFRVAASNR